MYDLTAVFPNVTGLHEQATVELAGVKIGWVETIELRDYAAIVTLRLDKQVRLQEDAIASIRTRGVLGDKYILLTPGERIREVGAPVDIETMIGRFIQGKL